MDRVDAMRGVADQRDPWRDETAGAMGGKGIG